MRLDGQAVPHHRDITSFLLEAVLTGPGAAPDATLPVRYEMHRSDGTVVAGVITFQSPP